MTTERIDVIVSEKGSRRVRRNIEDVGDGAKKSAGAVQLLQRALGALGGALAIRELQRLTDAYTNIQNRIRTVTDNTRELKGVTNELFAIANRTRQSFGGTAEVYTRVAQSAKELGVSQKEVLQFTESLNQAVILSGASADEAEAGVRQLSQGLASGALRGDELRSVLEQLPVVADTIAKELGVTRGKLRELGGEGKITADIVLEAFKSAREELSERFGKTIPTIGQAFTVLRNNITRFVGELATSSGVAELASRTILTLAENVGTLAKLVGTAATTIGVVFARQAIPAAIRAVGALTAAIAANPLGFLLVTLTSVISALSFFRNEINIGVDNITTLGDVFGVVGEKIGTLSGKIAEWFSKNIGNPLKTLIGRTKDFDLSVAGLVKTFAGMADSVIGTMIGLSNAIPIIFRNLPTAIGTLFFKAFNGAIAIVEGAANKFVDAIEGLFDLVGVTIDAGEISLGRIADPFAREANILGQAVGQAFRNGFKQTNVAGFVDTVFAEAQAAAKKREAAIGESAGVVKDKAEGIGQNAEDVASKIKEEAEKAGKSMLEGLGGGAEATANKFSKEAERILQDAFAAADALAKVQEAGSSGTSNYGIVENSGGTIYTSGLREQARKNLDIPLNTGVISRAESNRIQVAIEREMARLSGTRGREFGGPVEKGKPYIVGEKRAEVFVPDQNGTIKPSAGGDTFNITIEGDRDPERTAQRVVEIVNSRGRKGDAVIEESAVRQRQRRT